MYTLEAGRELVDTAAHELPVVVNLTFLLLDCERVSGRRDEVSRARVYPARVRGDWLVVGRLDIVGGGGLVAVGRMCAAVAPDCSLHCKRKQNLGQGGGVPAGFC